MKSKKYPPNPNLFPQPSVSNEAHLVLVSYAETIAEVRDFGTHVLGWFQTKVASDDSKATDAYLPILMLSRHVLEVADGISTLMHNDVVEPAKPLARSLFETALAIEYIIQEDLERRSMAFMVCHVLHRLQDLKILIAGTVQRASMSDSISKDLLLEGFDLPDESKAADQVHRYEGLLRKQGYSEALEEFERTKKKLRKTPSWYSFYNGPQNIRELAKLMESLARYDLFYRKYSGFIHGADIFSGKLVKDDSGLGAAVVQLRTPIAACEVMQFSLGVSIHLYRKMIDYFAPERGPEFRTWYAEEIRTHMLSPSRITVS